MFQELMTTFIVLLIQPGVTLLLINLSNQTEFILKVENGLSSLHALRNTIHRQSSIIRGVKRAVSWVGQKTSDGPFYREDYHLTPANGRLRSKTMLLNGTPLELTKDGDIPKLEPTFRNENSAVSITPRTIKFVVLPNFDAPACSWSAATVPRALFSMYTMYLYRIILSLLWQLQVLSAMQ